MKLNANGTLRALLSAIGFSLAAVSAYLTAIFLHDFGGTGGYGIPYSFAGVILDVAKTLFPLAALAVYLRGQRVLAVVAGGLAILMMLTSYNISVAALSRSYDQGQEQAVTQSQKHQDLTQAIELKRGLLEDKRHQQAKLMDINHLTKASQLQPEIDALVTDLSKLLLERGAKPVNSAGKFDTGSAKILAALIEITSTISILLASTVDQSLTRETNPTPSPTVETGSTPGDLPEIKKELEPIPEEVPHLVPQLDAEVPHLEPSEERAEENPYEDPLIVHAKQLLIDQIARPSERSLSDALSVRRPIAAEILNKLEESGFLVRDGRVRVLAL